MTTITETDMYKTTDIEDGKCNRLAFDEDDPIRAELDWQKQERLRRDMDARKPELHLICDEEACSKELAVQRKVANTPPPVFRLKITETDDGQ